MNTPTDEHDPIDKVFDKIEKHFEQMDTHFNQMEKHFEEIEKVFAQLDDTVEDQSGNTVVTKIWKNNVWTVRTETISKPQKS